MPAEIDFLLAFSVKVCYNAVNEPKGGRYHEASR